MIRLLQLTRSLYSTERQGTVGRTDKLGKEHKDCRILYIPSRIGGEGMLAGGRGQLVGLISLARQTRIAGYIPLE